MADAFRGLTLRIGADTRPLASAINSITRSASQAQSQFNRMTRALKMDPADTKVMASRIDLVGDRATHAAAAASKISAAMRQAGRETLTFSGNAELSGRSVASIARSTTDVYAQTQRLRAEYNHVDAELQVINDAVRTIVASQRGITFDDARKHVNGLQRAMSGVGHEASAARREMESIIRAATRQSGLGNAFGLGSSIGDARQMVGIYHELRSQQKTLNSDLEAMNTVEGYRAAKANARAFRAELRGAAAEAARLKSELYSAGESAAMQRATSHAKALDAAVEASVASAKRMSSAFKAIPADINAARARLTAFRAEGEAVASKIEALKAVMGSAAKSSFFDEAKARFGDVYTAVSRAESKVADLGVAAKVAEAKVSGLEAELSELRSRSGGEYLDGIRELRGELSRARAEVDRVRSAMERAEGELRSANLAKVWREARDEVMRYEAELQRMNASKSMGAILGSIGSSVRTMGYGLYSTITPAVMIAGRYAIQAADDIDSAYRNMRKTVNGTEEEFEHLRQAALDFSTTHVTTADTILEIEALGGQLGIASRNLGGFAETVSNLDIATDIEAGDLATYVGQLSNIMDDISAHKNDPEEYQKRITSLSDSLVRLGNNSAAQESSIMKVMMRIASMGNISDMTTPQLLAISTAIAATGQGCEAAGTAISKTFSDIESAVSAGEDKLQAWSEVAGMSAEEFARSWKEEPVQAFTAFIEGLKRIDDEGGSVDGTLKGLEINSVRQKQALMGLTNTLDVLRDALGMSQDAWDGMSTVMADGSVEKAGDAAREAQKKSEGFSGELQMMKNNATMLAISLADGAAPIIGKLGDMFRDAASAADSMPDSLKTATVGLLGLAAAAGPAFVGFGSLADGIASAREAWKGVGQVLTMSKAQRLEYRALSDAIEAVRAKQSAYIAETGASCPKIAAQEQALLGQQKALTGTATAAQVAGKALKGIGVGLAVGAASFAIASAIDYFSDAAEKTKKYRDGIDGMADAMGKAEAASGGMSSGLRSAAAYVNDSLPGLDEYRKRTDGVIDAQGDLAESINSSLDGTEESGALAQTYAERIMSLAGSCEGSLEKLSILKTLIDEYNELTGSSVSITDGYSGAINRNTEQLDANTAAYKANARAKAYAEAASDLYKQNASAEVALDKLEEKYKALMGIIEDPNTDPIARYNANMERYDIEAQIEKQKKIISTNEKAIRSFEEKGSVERRNAKEAEEGYKKLIQNVEDYAQAVSASKDEFSQQVFDVSLGHGFDDTPQTIEEFVEALNNAGISAERFGSVGVDAFNRFYEQAHGDLSRVAKAINVINDTELEPKDIYIDDEGSIRLTQEGLERLDEFDPDDKHFIVTDDGTIKIVQGALDFLDGYVAMPIVDVNTEDAMRKLREVQQKLYSMGGRINFTTGEVVLPGQASGGVNMRPLKAVRAFASGGSFINGIVTAPTLTNQGLIGEAGAEAVLNYGRRATVVPLTNRRYVAPFARAVAAEMPGAGPSITDSSTTYQIYLDGSLLAGDANGSLTLAQLVHEVKVKAGAN